MWVHKLRHRLTVELCTPGGPTYETLNTIRKIPKDLIREILAGLPIHKAVLACLESAEAPRLPGATA